MDRLTQIRDLIDRANHAYYNTGVALLEDATYDSLKEELKVLAPSDPRHAQVGAPVVRDSIRQKRQHAIPMGSQNKADTKEKFLRFVAGLGLGSGVKLHANLKVDGGSLSLEYVNGALFQAITRGDGIEGDDITANALLFANTPRKVTTSGGTPFTGHVRVEVVLPVDAWKLLDPDLTSNPRNFGNGIAGRKDGSDSQHLRIVAFRAYDQTGADLAATESGVEAELKAMGFDTARSVAGTADDVLAFFEAIRAERNTLSHWIDGIVVKVDDIATQAAFGVSQGCPNGQIAVKFPAEGASTVIREVKLTVGHTGAIIPTARFDAVQLGGTTVECATLHNWDEIRALNVAIGDTVLVEKRGDIIPAVMAVLDRPSSRQPITEPTICPCCGSPLERRTTIAGEESAHLYCVNDDCPSRVLGKLKRWVKSLNILGLGSENLAALIAQMGMKDAADLYRLKDNLPGLAAVEVSSGVRLGMSRAIKILAEIDAKRALTLGEFFGSLGVDGLGKRRVELIQRAAPGQMDTLADWTSGKLATLAAVTKALNAGELVATELAKEVPLLEAFMAAKTQTSGARFADDIAKKQPLIDRLLAAGVTIKDNAPVAPSVVNPGAKSFCITGALSKPKGHFQQLIGAKGHIYKDSVAKGLDYLVMADPSSTSSKAEKARKLGVKCIGEAELLAVLGE